MKTFDSEIAEIGAGIAGLAVAYYLAISGSGKKVTLIDQGAAMGFTSVHSGENYRNWWPHPVMRALTDLSIDLLEDIAGQHQIALTCRDVAMCLQPEAQILVNF